MWPQIAREQLGAGNAGFATSWELPGSWEPGSLLRKTASWEAILGIKTTGSPWSFACMPEAGKTQDSRSRARLKWHASAGARGRRARARGRRGRVLKWACSLTLDLATREVALVSPAAHRCPLHYYS